MDQRIRQDFRLQAILAHQDQMYGEHPYAFHLAYVEVKLISHGFDSDKWRATAWWHDALEDTATERAFLESLYSKDVADICFACSGFGLNRKARNADIKAKIRDFPLAAPVKAADRLANGEHSKRNNTRQFPMYQAENPEFIELVGPHIPIEMLAELKTLFA